MWFPFMRRHPRRQRRANGQAERLESRELLTLTQLTAPEVETLLERGAGASKSKDAIIAVVDRGGHILGVRVEQGVLNAIDAVANGGNGDHTINAGSQEERTLVYAIDGAVAKARTAAFFANGSTTEGTVGPLTSRTVRFISQSTITQREMQSNPNVTTDTLRGPGYIAPVGIGGHFPPAIAFTPQVDLFGIEHTNRDSIVHPGLNSIHETTDVTVVTDPASAVIGGDDILLPGRFNATFIPGQEIDAPESYGFVSGRMVDAQSRGIATLPGGIPLYDGADLIGGIGVFFPGTVDPDGPLLPGRIGDATFEQGFVAGKRQTEAQRTNAPKVLEAEWIAFAAAGGSSNAGAKVGAFKDLNGVTVPAVRFDYPFGRIDLVGITLQLIGPTPGITGVRQIQAIGKKLGKGDSLSGANQVVDTLGATVLPGEGVPDGWLVAAQTSADGLITAADVTQIINQGIASANKVRAAIRLKLAGKSTNPGARTRMVFAVTDKDGNVLGIYRMPDATVFSIDVSVAKARNTAYYADATQLQDIDRVDDNHNSVPDASVPAGAALTNRTFRFLAEPRFPQGTDSSQPGAFSILNDPGFKNNLLKSSNPNINTGAVENAGDPTAYTDFDSVLGFDSFNPGTNFRRGEYIESLGLDPTSPVYKTLVANQNGIVFFPGSVPVYNKTGVLIGGFGVSGDGVDQDDVVTFFGRTDFAAPQSLRADQYFVRGVRLPYQKFNRNPFA